MALSGGNRPMIISHISFSHSTHKASSFVHDDYSLISFDHQGFFQAATSVTMEVEMRKTNSFSGFGSLFAAGTALVSPMHELVTREPLYQSAQSPGRRPLLFRLIVRLGGALERWRQHQEQRRRLATLSDHLLRDVGLTRNDVERELRKTFWP
ncbi:MAG: DUF1127 domain-containing protein [Geminicoccaceae bacterium]